jgi:hypothetical protein
LKTDKIINQIKWPFRVEEYHSLLKEKKNSNSLAVFSQESNFSRFTLERHHHPGPELQLTDEKDRVQTSLLSTRHTNTQQEKEALCNRNNKLHFLSQKLMELN